MQDENETQEAKTTTTEDIRKAIRDNRRLARMRMGQEAPEFVTLRSNPEIRMIMVPLTEAEYEYGLTLSAAIEAPDNPQGVELRDRKQQVCDLYHSLRNPSDITEKLFESPEQVAEELEQIDINHLGEEYMRIVNYSSPALDGLTDEDLEELKKALAVIDLSVLSGEAWWHLSRFFSTLTHEQLAGSLYGRSSTTRSTGESDKAESTLGASES